MSRAHACGGEPGVRELQQHAAFDQCRKSAVGDAVAQVNSPVLTAMAGDKLQPVSMASR